ncbi:hypothetical protein [Flavobacterium suzhouense]|uniref:DUF1129 family protein n=1 Tax=Flavobacterium suzhouense TaxID=1529638 RepID=A0ABW5NWB2_9FLAO
MKLTKEQIAKIEEYLVKDRIFYDDIRMEMTDHIAATLEEKLKEDGDFELALKEYMNSHLKVKLLTAVREQEVLRDKQNRNTIFRQLAGKRGIIFFILLCTVIELSTFEVWAFRFFEAIMMLGIFAYMIVERWMPGNYLFVKRIYSVSMFYYMLPVLFALKINKLLGEAQWVYCINGVLLSLIFTLAYLTLRMNNDIKTNRYA